MSVVFMVNSGGGEVGDSGEVRKPVWVGGGQVAKVIPVPVLSRYLEGLEAAHGFRVPKLAGALEAVLEL